MSPDVLIAHFGGLTKTARAMGVRPPSVHEWRAKGYVPIGRQFQAEVITKGALIADRQPAMQEG